MTQEQLLLFTIEHFNSNNRCIDKNENCSYAPMETSKGCAIGIHLIGTQEEKETWDKSKGMGINTAIDKIKNDEIPDLRPEWMKSMSIDFLGDVQRLHDYSSNWNNRGLTKTGKLHAKSIINLHNLDGLLFKHIIEENPSSVEL